MSEALKDHLRFETPAMIRWDAPQDYGVGRKCHRCKGRVNRFSGLGRGEKKPMCFSCRQKRIDKAIADERRRAELTTLERGWKLPSLKAYRLGAGLTQKQLAWIVETNPAYISQIERGICGAGFGLAARLAEAVGTTSDELREEVEI